MIHLPVLTKLEVREYGLFPGDPRGDGIVWPFRQGLSLIAGINGLGKTTLLTMILRSLTGPYDLTSTGEPPLLSVVLPPKPVALRPDHTKFFERRVADGAKNATVTLSAQIGESHVTIRRRLKDISLESLAVDRRPVELPTIGEKRERTFQNLLTNLVGLASFVDVLLVLHHVIMFHENRPGALWDPNAQRQLLRALSLDTDDAARIVSLERALQSADSQARNIHARITATERQRRKALQREAGAEGILAAIEAEQELLDAELREVERLQDLLERFDEARKTARLAHERAKIERENAVGSVERLKYTALLNHFPTMDDATRLVMSRIMTENRCLVCNTVAEEPRLELERRIADGRCVVCGTKRSTSTGNLISLPAFSEAQLKRERERVARAKLEEETVAQQLSDATTEYDKALNRLAEVRRSIDERKRKDRRLRAKLPQSTTSLQFDSVLKALRADHRDWRERRAIAVRDLGSLLASRKETITAKSTQLVNAFLALGQALLIDNVRLAQVTAEPSYMQAPGDAHERLHVPAYAAEMEAADRPGFVRRGSSSEVSESQRELVDLAFRLALVEVLGGPCTFVMETPEASLDGLAMQRVGGALSEFANSGTNRLVVTSNLSNAGIITALFGGPATDQPAEERLERVLNLLQVAAPNRALGENRSHYMKMLWSAVTGAEQ